MESRYKSGKPASVADFRREIEFLKSAGKLPSLEEVLAAVAEAKATYQQRLPEVSGVRSGHSFLGSASRIHVRSKFE